MTEPTSQEIKCAKRQFDDAARLRAAAPELLAACHAALDYFNETRNGKDWRNNGGAEPGILRAAIAKAEERSKL